MQKIFYIGVDIGSTTVKVVLLNQYKEIVFKKYERHHSKVREKACEVLSEIRDIVGDGDIYIAISGSAGIGVSENTDIKFVQEVFATKTACDIMMPDTDVVIELGGEDAKILFLTGVSEERMNGSCAGGTGAFIDQMASLLAVTVDELDELSAEHQQIYNIASRCGVFAKSDIQPLLNQGANKADVAASIYQAIVNQTIAGLAQGREIKGKVAFLGGPLTFLKGLRERFIETLKLTDETAIFPENSQYFVAIGASVHAMDTTPLKYNDILERFSKTNKKINIIDTLPPLFKNFDEYDVFKKRHSKNTVKKLDISTYSGKAYLGIDAGSTTTKVALITKEGDLLYDFYASNNGDPLPIVKAQLEKITELCGERIKIRASAVTGYGEELLKNAFGIDAGIVETIAHYFAAKHFNPNVDFILDIGGQDMKCFRLKNGVVDSIMLNEACSSGCGSFIETFAHAMGYEVSEFATLALSAKNPVNLGSRCTVFMNSSVKQSQKDGATVEDISAGLAVSVVKNAVYKVIRAKSPKELGSNIVVQGGTFLNDAILRAFELEIGMNVTRPSIAGLMGAYGAALYASKLNIEKTKLITPDKLQEFTHTSKLTECRLCTNNCKLTVNIFNEKDRYISGNRCERPLGKSTGVTLPNAYEYKLKKLFQYKKSGGTRGKIGLPLGLNMYENLPFWHTLLSEVGFEVVVSGLSTRKTYTKGQHTIPSDTVCYPAKLMHGHIEELIDLGINTIFYPCMTYNFDEGMGDNHYNCPVVAYYPELLNANIDKLGEIKFLAPFFAPHHRRMFEKKIAEYFKEQFGVSKKETLLAVDKAYKEYANYKKDIYQFGQDAINYARENGRQIIVLCGRPYHIDPEINHGIDRLITSLGLVVISEDCLDLRNQKYRVNVLNQWTYHSRLYGAAKYVGQEDDMFLVQLVSFGCGLDAITTDEVRDILQENDKIYTQIKIDEISNLGAAKIRLRSLIETVKPQGK